MMREKTKELLDWKPNAELRRLMDTIAYFGKLLNV